MLSKRRLFLSGLMAGLMLAIGAVPAQAGSPSPAPQPVEGERYLTAKVNGQETRYLAPARNDREL